MFTGNYAQGNALQSGRIVEKELYHKRYGSPVYYEVAERFVQYARSVGVNPVTLAVSWVKAHPGITAPIIGARTVEQLQDSLAAAEFVMSTEMRDEISKLSLSPGIATDRLKEEFDEKYKFRGR